MMTDGEWETFWQRVDARRQRAAGPDSQSETEGEPSEEEEELRCDEVGRPAYASQAWFTDSASARRRTMRANRCGSCAACRAKDCGTCKNCLDKPRFGGPGVKKKACLARVCLTAPELPTKEPDEYSDAETAPVSPVLAASRPQFEPQPQPQGGGPCAPALERRPLLPLDMQSALATFNFGGGCSLDLLSRAAPMPQH